MDSTPFPPPRSPWPAPTTPEPTTREPRVPRLSAAGWLAATGASLLLVASIIVVAGSWESIDPIVRFSGLVASLLAVYFVAEAGRRRFPTTSTSLATLAACLTAPVGVAAAATLGQPWSVCTLVGGLAALAATEVQSRRWDVAPLQAAVVAFGLAAVGLSALIAVPAPVIGAAGAVAGLTLGSTRRTLTLAVTVGASPLLVALADAGIGPGTLARIGATGDVLVWSAPLSCTVAAVVIAVIAQRLQNTPLAVASVAVLLSVVTSLLGGDVDGIVWFCVPAIVLLAVEAVAATRTDSVWRRLARTTTVPLGAGLITAALVVPVVAVVARGAVSAAMVADDRWYVPVGSWTVALIAAACGTARRIGGGWSSMAPLAATTAAMSTLALAGAPMWSFAVAALVGWVVITAVTPWAWWDVTTATLASWVLLASLIGDGPSVFWLPAVIVAGACTVSSCAAVDRRDAGFRSIVAAALAALGSHAAIDASTAVPATTSFGLGAVVFVGLIALAVSIRPERATWPLVIAGYVTLLAITDDPSGAIGWFAVATTAALAGAVAGSTRSASGARAQVAAGIGTIAGGLALAAAGVDAGTSVVASSLVGIGLTGLSTLDRRLVVGRSAGVVASTIAVVASGAASPVFSSIAAIVLGAQVIALGATTGRRWLLAPGTLLAAGASVSLWWTTGTNQWMIEAITPYGADGGDLALAAVSAALLTVGWLLRRTLTVSSWLAYSPGLGMVGAWLIATQLEAGTDWATFGALAVGTTAIALGGVRRLGAPLVLGTVMLVATILVSAGARLAATPTWVWIAVGGTALLVIAALIERSERPLLPVGRRGEQRRSLLEQFCDEFQ